jgi:hypothetical protein
MNRQHLEAGGCVSALELVGGASMLDLTSGAGRFVSSRITKPRIAKPNGPFLVHLTMAVPIADTCRGTSALINAVETMELEPTTPCLQIGPRGTPANVCERVRPDRRSVGTSADASVRLGMVHEMVYIRPGGAAQFRQRASLGDTSTDRLPALSPRFARVSCR